MRLYDSKRPLATIPNLAIHMNREINKGIELNRQADMLPLLGMGEDEDAFMTFLAKELQVPVEDILDFELSIYVWEEPAQIGLREDMISSPRIDNISSCAAIMEAMCQATCDKHLNIAFVTTTRRSAAGPSRAQDLPFSPMSSKRSMNLWDGRLGLQKMPFIRD